MADNLSASTTLTALRIDTGERITIEDLPMALLRQLSDAQVLRCPVCDGLLRLKAGMVRIHHFAHVNLAACHAEDYEPETDAHRQGKLRLYQHFRQGASSGTLEQYIASTGQRADVYFEQDGIYYVLEFQQANNTFHHWLDRHQSYHTAGYRDIWFLGQVRYYEHSRQLAPISPFEPLPMLTKEFSAAMGVFAIREMEKAMLTLSPRLLYLDPQSNMISCLLAKGQLNNNANTLHAYRYIFPLTDCQLRQGRLWTPIDPHLKSYWSYMAAHWGR